MTIYRIALRDRETQTVVGYYNGAWTTDQHRALTLRRREVAEDHAARHCQINFCGGERSTRRNT